jgi:hypothetical protein
LWLFVAGGASYVQGSVDREESVLRQAQVWAKFARAKMAPCMTALEVQVTRNDCVFGIIDPNARPSSREQQANKATTKHQQAQANLDAWLEAHKGEAEVLEKGPPKEMLLAAHARDGPEEALDYAGTTLTFVNYWLRYNHPKFVPLHSIGGLTAQTWVQFFTKVIDMLTADQRMHLQHRERHNAEGKASMVMHHHCILSQREPSAALMDRLKELGHKAHDLEKHKAAGTDAYGVLKAATLEHVHAEEEEVNGLLRDTASLFEEFIRATTEANYYWPEDKTSVAEAAGAVGEMKAHEYDTVTSSSPVAMHTLGHRACLVQLRESAAPMKLDPAAEEASESAVATAEGGDGAGSTVDTGGSRVVYKLERKMSIGARSAQSKLSARETMRREEAKLFLQVRCYCYQPTTSVTSVTTSATIIRYGAIVISLLRVLLVLLY